MAGNKIKDLQAERLAQALRENLKRRKAQARGRKAVDKADTTDIGAASKPATTELKPKE